MLHPYLKKGKGKLCSSYNYKPTIFSEKRKEKIIKEQIVREKVNTNQFNPLLILCFVLILPLFKFLIITFIVKTNGSRIGSLE
tara:strand:+ start:1087 stop:1335 length:249 start_codon:yes stop_codon:yes gene_type:complete